MLFLVTFPSHSKPKGREAGLCQGPHRAWDGLLPQGCLMGPKEAQRLPSGNLEWTESMKQHKWTERPGVGDQGPRTRVTSGAATGATGSTGYSLEAAHIQQQR